MLQHGRAFYAHVENQAKGFSMEEIQVGGEKVPHDLKLYRQGLFGQADAWKQQLAFAVQRIASAVP
eukprot:6492573-Amphidinium_carterae.3